MNILRDLRFEGELFPIDEPPDLTRLAARLCERDYHEHARGAILAHARAVGTLEGCPDVEPEDRADLDAILESAWPAVPIASGAWDDRWATPRAVERWDGSDRSATAAVADPGRLSAAWTLRRPDRLEALAERFAAEQYFDEVPWDGPGAEDGDFDPSEEDQAFFAAWLAAREPYDLPELEPFHP